MIVLTYAVLILAFGLTLAIPFVLAFTGKKKSKRVKSTQSIVNNLNRK